MNTRDLESWDLIKRAENLNVLPACLNGLEHAVPRLSPRYGRVMRTLTRLVTYFRQTTRFYSLGIAKSSLFYVVILPVFSQHVGEGPSGCIVIGSVLR
jgi:hypothetical protein